MSYKNYRASLSIGSYVDDIYVEVRNWKDIVGFIDAHDINGKYPSYTSRLPLLKAFSEIAPSWYVEYQSAVPNSQITSHPAPLTNIKVYDTNAQVTNIDCDQLKTFIESLGGHKLSGRLPSPPNYPGQMSTYSVWHYKLDYNCQCRDIDYTEFRDGKIAAFIETTGKLSNLGHLQNSLPQIKQRLNLQIKIMSQLSQQFDAPAYIVVHLTDLSYFEVYDLSWNSVLKGNQAQYSNWLASL